MSATTAYEQLLDALRDRGSDVKETGQGKAIAQCPAHNDRNPSLSITRTEGRTLVYCHAGCQTVDVLAALNLTMADLYDEPFTHPKHGQVYARYNYPGGRVVLRTANKQFPQPGNNKDRSLYHADRIGDAKTVYFVEGEEDVHAAEAHGAAAVCSAMGAAKAKHADLTPLAGKDVVVVADKDKPGRDHAAQVAELLDGIAASVTITEPAVGKDTSDHLVAGKTLDELVLVEPITEGVPRLWRALDLKPAAQARWLAKARLMMAAINLLIGDEGIGKSLLWVWIVAAVTTGKALPEFGIPARKPGIGIVVCTEDHWSTEVRPRLEVAGADLAMVRVVCTDDDGSGAPIFPRDLFLITEANPAPALVVVDAWLDTVPPGLSVRDPQQARQALHPWKEAATATGAAMLLVCHTNRVASATARDRYGATGELRKKARMTLFGQQDDEGLLVIGPEKMNAAAPIPASKFTIKAVQHFPPTVDHDGTVPLLTYVGESAQTAREHVADAYAADHDTTGGDDAVAWLAAFLAAGPRWAADGHNAAKEAKFTERKIKRAKQRLNVVSDRDTPNGPWFWRLPQHQGTPGGRPEDPSPDSCTSGTSGTSGNSQKYASTSQDSQRVNGDTRRHLNGNDPALPDLYDGLCPCGKFPARHDTGLCEWCTAKANK